MRTASISKTEYNRDVYEPSDDSFALVDALKRDTSAWGSFRPAVIVEVGSGSGFVVCSMAQMLQDLDIHSHLIAVDISAAATLATQRTLDGHGMLAHVDILQTDMFSSLDQRLQSGVDLLLFNPPYVVTPDEEVGQSGIAAAWAGGKDGRVVIDKMLGKLDGILSKTGRMYMIAIQQNRPQQILQEARTRFGFHGKVLLTRQADEELLSVLLVSRLPVT
jgi:release factor glutamine methyltransferase